MFRLRAPRPTAALCAAALCLSVALAAAPPAGGAPSTAWCTEVIEMPDGDRLSQVLLRDLDGDGRAELAALHRAPWDESAPDRPRPVRLSVWLGGQTGRTE